tara:strand:- start:1394 stop:1666 length:273 start_codon:yes stop_codon:yes gene_type:complete
MNTFDMMWCSEIQESFKSNGFIVSYDDDTFKAVHPNDVTTRFMIKINKTDILTTIPLHENYEYISIFSDYFKVAEYILYHLKDYQKNKQL